MPGRRTAAAAHRLRNHAHGVIAGRRNRRRGLGYDGCFSAGATGPARATDRMKQALLVAALTAAAADRLCNDAVGLRAGSGQIAVIVNINRAAIAAGYGAVTAALDCRTRAFARSDRARRPGAAVGAAAATDRLGENGDAAAKFRLVGTAGRGFRTGITAIGRDIALVGDRNTARHRACILPSDRLTIFGV